MKIKNILFYGILLMFFSLTETNLFSQEKNEVKFTLEDINGNQIDFTRSELIELLCSNEWNFGYLYINFLDNGIYESGVQESYEGKWEMDENGDIHVEPRVEGVAENLLRLRSTYCLTDEYGKDAFYNKEYYEANSVSEESKTIAEIELSNITKDHIIGIWVTDEQGPMGELLGFEFTSDHFYFGHPGLEIPFGCWDEVNYGSKGTWGYDKEKNIIMIFWKTEDYSETITIQLTSFYNGAFKGIISPEFFFDEVGDSERVFWKSECE